MMILLIIERSLTNMYYKYKVKQINFDANDRLDTGIVCAYDYGSAANRVIHSYGADQVANLFLEKVGDNIVADNEDYCLSKEEVMLIFGDEP